MAMRGTRQADLPLAQGGEGASPLAGSPQPWENRVECLLGSALSVFLRQLDKVEGI